MKNIFLFLVLASLIVIGSCDNKEKESLPRDGDIVFMRLDIGQIKSLKLLSNSDYTHTGVIFIQKDTVFVYEGAGKVGLSLLESWTGRRSKDSMIVIKRLKKEYQTKEYGRKLINAGVKFKDLPTDIIFDWSDTMVYSSELVWKIYDRGLGIQLSDLKKMKEWNTSDKFVNHRLNSKYGIENPFNPENSVVSPDDLFYSDKLETVYSGKMAYILKEK